MSSLESVFEESQAEKNKVFTANLIAVTSTVIDSVLFARFDLGVNQNEWHESPFRSKFDITLKSCHQSGLAFTSIFGMHDQIIFVVHVAVQF